MTNLLLNPRFYGNLSEWTGSGTINRSLGYPRDGCAEIAADQSISQAVATAQNSLYSLHWFFRLSAGATLTASYGAVASLSYSTADYAIDVWHEAIIQFAPSADSSESVTFAAAGGACYVDGIALIAGGVPITRSEIARRLEVMLSQLAIDAELSREASADGPEGDYSYAIDDALRAQDAAGTYGEPDVTMLATSEINNLVALARTSMLQRLRAKYAFQYDVQLGPRSESRSQIAKSIEDMLGGSSGGGSGGTPDPLTDINRAVEQRAMARAGGWER